MRLPHTTETRWGHLHLVISLEEVDINGVLYRQQAVKIRNN